jgi:pyrimidine-nucleoside phosphorylase
LNFLALIEAKREGRILAPEQIREFIREFTAGSIPDYQMAALLMAIYFRGLDTAETTALTLAMRDSGERLRFPRDPRPLVDKHSTGGIGDKVSLPLAPLLACLGFRVPMISGRGLGITGGTLDKLDSIPGCQTLLPVGKIVAQVQAVGCVICGQTDSMVPADKKIYALRDASGTVPSIPLITASILSKKLAENLDALVLDVKYGCAAFMQTRAEARRLARAMVALGNACGTNTRALLTDMNTPLGRAAGNWLEVKESVACLEPSGCVRENAAENMAVNSRSRPRPQGIADLRALVLDCAAQLLVQTRKTRTLAAARKLAEACLNSGAARQKWDEMLVAQGADLAAVQEKLRCDATAKVVVEVEAGKSGFVSQCDARIIGEVIRDLGGGRHTKESAINYDVGVDQMAKPGERVERGGVLCRVHATNSAQAKAAAARLETAFVLSPKRQPPSPLVVELVR